MTLGPVAVSRAARWLALAGAVVLLHGALAVWLLRAPRHEAPRWPTPVMLAASRSPTHDPAPVGAGPPVEKSPAAGAAGALEPAPPTRMPVTATPRRSGPVLKQQALADRSGLRGATALPAAAPRATPQWPVEPTVLPESFAARYTLRRGALTGEAHLRWQRDEAAYTAGLTARLDDAPLFDWTSRGALDDHGVAPERFVARGRRGQAAAANFQRASGHITYAGPSTVHPLPPGAQDRLSWLVQLAGIVAATPERFAAPGAQVVLFVSGARGDAQVWQVEGRGRVTLELGGAPREALHFVREAARPYDQRVEVWLDVRTPAAPLRLLLVTAGREDQALDLTRLAP